MGLSSAIEWTDATWNPVTGCSRSSPGCKHCYAERLSRRLKAMGNPRYRNGFAVTLQPDNLNLPLRWRQPRRVFVNSMSDLFHERVPFEYVDRVFGVMLEAQQHVFQVLTKRPERLVAWHRGPGRSVAVPRNVWVGVSVESLRYAWRVDRLREVDAAVRFISAEPLLGSLANLDLRGISWLIAGGESAGSPRRALVEVVDGRPRPKAEAERWVLELLEICQAAGVAFFFFKQWGGRTPKAGGRELAGQTWSQYPVVE